MIRSMTGFASKTIVITGTDESKSSVSFSLKSLNSRYFDTNCKLPYPLSNWETELIKLFKERLYRGYISFIVQLSNPNIFKGPIEPSLETIKGYLAALDTVQQTFKLPGELEIKNILDLPNIFNAPEKELDSTIKDIFFQVVRKLLDELVAAQEKEGQMLLADMKKRIALMTTHIAEIETALKALMEEQKKKVQQGLEEIGLDDDRYADLKKNALYAYLDKIDIHEEIVRFKSHLENLEHTLHETKQEKGKRLDFILQELGREINTITAKCSDSTISSHAITIKVEVEKVREQAQNIV